MRKLNDAVLYERTCGDVTICRVLALTEDGRCVIKPFSDNYVEDKPCRWPLVGVFRRGLFGGWKFVPNQPKETT